MVSTVLLLAFTLIAAVTDGWKQRIYNWTTFPGMLTGVLVSTLEPEGIGWEESLLGFVGCGLIMVFCFLAFPAVGGGDVKLIAMQSTFLGWYHGLECMLWTFVLGSALAISVLIWRFGIVRLIRRGLQQVWWLVRYRSSSPLSSDERAALKSKLHLAPAAFLAAIIVRFSLLG